MTVLRRLRRGARSLSSRLRGREAVFAATYHANGWGDPDSVSGPGSNLVETEAIRAALPALLERYGVRSLLDAPCGDFHWMQHTALDVDEYVGAEIVRELVEENTRRYGRPGRRFVQADLVRDPLPHADLVLCRDCLVHLPFADALRVVENVRRSGATYLLTTTFPALPRNWNIAAGDWRPLNLESAPFGFPPPLEMVAEGGASGVPDKSLGLWAVADLPANPLRA